MLPLVVLGAAAWYLSRSNRNPQMSLFDYAEEQKQRQDADRLAYEEQILASYKSVLERLHQQLAMIDDLRRDERDKQYAKYGQNGRVPVVVPSTPEWERLSIGADRVKQNIARTKRLLQDQLTKVYALRRNPTRRRAPSHDAPTARAAQLSLDAHGPSATPAARAAYRKALDESLHARAAAGDVATLPGFEDLAAAPSKGKSVQRGFFGLLNNPRRRR